MHLRPARTLVAGLEGGAHVRFRRPDGRMTVEMLTACPQCRPQLLSVSECPHPVEPKP